MKVTIEEKYQAAIIELKGDLIGGENAKLFREKLYELINQNKKNLVVDMSDVKFVSSTGIGNINQRLYDLEECRGRFETRSHI